MAETYFFVFSQKLVDDSKTNISNFIDTRPHFTLIIRNLPIASAALGRGRRGPNATGKRLYVGDTDLTAHERVDDDTRVRAAVVAARVLALVDKLPPGAPIGLEKNFHARTLPDVSAGVSTGRLRRLGVTFVDDVRPEIHDRPPSEYGVLHLFEAMSHGPLTMEHLGTAARMMGGTAIWRDAPATTYRFASGHYTEFPHPLTAIPAFVRLLSQVAIPNNPEAAVIRATATYFATTLLHPLRDGNGRAARALFQCVLKADLGVSTPIFPLGSFFEVNKTLLLDAKYRWQLDGDARALVRLLTNCLDAFCRTYEAELRATPAAP